MNCYLCSSELTDATSSEEHLIANCIGGRLTINTLLCATCNQRTSIYEKELAKMGSVFMNHYNIKKDRGGYNAPTEAIDELTGNEIMYHPGGKVTFTKPIVEFDTQDREFRIEAYNLKRAQQELDKIIKEKSNQGFDVDLSRMKIETKFNPDDKRVLNTTLHTGNHLVIKAILKMFLNYYVYKGGDKNCMIKLIEYIANINVIDNRFCNCYFKNISHAVFDSKPIHIILIKNDKREVKGYFELFGTIGYIAVLSTEYKGKDFLMEYAYDPVNKEELTFTYPFEEKVYDILQYFNSNIDPNSCIPEITI